MKLLHFGGKSLLRQKGKKPSRIWGSLWHSFCCHDNENQVVWVQTMGLTDYLWVWNLFARLWLVVFCGYSGFLQPLCMSVDVNVHVSMHGRENNFVEMFYFVFKVNRSKSSFITEWTEISKFWIHCNIIITRICTSKEKTSKKKKAWFKFTDFSLFACAFVCCICPCRN